MNSRRTITVQGDGDRSVVNAQKLVGMARRALIPGRLESYPGVYFYMQGDSNESAETGHSIGRHDIKLCPLILPKW